MEISIKNPSWLYRSKWGKKMELYSFDIFSQKQTMPLNWQGKITAELDFLILYFVFFFSCEHPYCPIKLHLKFFYLQWDLNMIIDISQFEHRQENSITGMLWKLEGQMLLSWNEWKWWWSMSLQQIWNALLLFKNYYYQIYFNKESNVWNVWTNRYRIFPPKDCLFSDWNKVI